MWFMSLKLSMIKQILFACCVAVLTMFACGDKSSYPPTQWLRNSEHSNVTALAGRNISLKCPLLRNGEQKVAWIKFESRTILSAHDELVTQSKRYAIENKEQQSVDLIITDIRPVDKGTYICQINTNPMKNLVIHVRVVQAPTFQDNASNKLIVKSGDSINLACDAEGNPKPTITWRKQLETSSGTDFLSTSNTLQLRTVTREDEGRYLCVASNGFPPSVSRTFHIKVAYKPIIHIKIFRMGQGRIKIRCSIKSFPLPTSVGLKQRGKSLIFTESREIQNSSVQLITDVKFSSKKEKFICYAMNDIGESRESLVSTGYKNIKPNDIESQPNEVTQEQPKIWNPSFMDPKNIYTKISYATESTTTAVTYYHQFNHDIKNNCATFSCKYYYYMLISVVLHLNKA